MQDINQMMYDLFTRMFHAIWKVFQALVRRSRTHHLSNMAYFCTYAEMQRTYGAGLLLSRWSPLSFWLRHKSEIIIVCAVLSFRTSNNQQVQQSWRTAELIGEASFFKAWITKFKSHLRVPEPAFCCTTTATCTASQVWVNSWKEIRSWHLSYLHLQRAEMKCELLSPLF